MLSSKAKTDNEKYQVEITGANEIFAEDKIKNDYVTDLKKI